MIIYDDLCLKNLFLINFPAEESFSGTHSDLFSIYFLFEFSAFPVKVCPILKLFPESYICGRMILEKVKLTNRAYFTFSYLVFLVTESLL